MSYRSLEIIMQKLDRLFKCVWLLTASFLLAACGSSEDDSAPIPGDADTYQHEVVLDGLTHPWAMAFLPMTDPDLMLLTERVGRLRLLDLDKGEVQDIEGLPEIASIGQGGLLDVALYPDFGPGNEWVYLSYSAMGEAEDQYALHVGRGRLNLVTLRLDDFERLFVATPFTSGGQHFGSRLAFDDQWRLYVTSGDRGDRNSAQDLNSTWGKVIRLERDGRTPADNPFVGRLDADDRIFTYGHRNPQGLALNPATGQLWENEHGEQQGDEINILDVAGGNYGWPVATYSAEYGSGQPIGDAPSDRPDTVDPVFYWDGRGLGEKPQGFPPSGMAFYYGDAFPAWEGQLLMGNLAHRYLGRFEIQGRSVGKKHRMLAGLNLRIRDMAVHPSSGEIFVLADEDPAPLLRIFPAPSMTVP